MEQTKLFKIILIALMVLGWGSVGIGLVTGDNKAYREHIAQAEDYMDRELYQKAAMEYEEALLIKDKEQIWTALLEAHELRYQENPNNYDKYLDAATRAVSAYEKNASFVMSLAKLYVADEDYDAACKCLTKALENGAKDPRIEELMSDVRYAFEIQWDIYPAIKSYANGYYLAKEEDGWMYVASDGSSSGITQLDVAGAMGQDGIYAASYDKKTIIADTEGVIQGKLDFIPQRIGVYAEGLIAIQKDDVYSYYDLLGDKQFGNYTNASAYYDGKAAVQENGKWYLIDTTGEKVGKQSYDNIVLNADGSYIKNGVMIAKKDGAYHLYDDSEKMIGSFSCKKIDKCTEDGLIAFSDGKKWGYVNTEGKIIIQPTYKKAKSFSNGFAGVYDGEFWGVINEEQELVIDYAFYDIDYFNDARACMVETAKKQWQMLTFYVSE